MVVILEHKEKRKENETFEQKQFPYFPEDAFRMKDGKPKCFYHKDFSSLEDEGAILR